MNESIVVSALGSMSTAHVLPFRFLAAARYAAQWEAELEQAMLRSVTASEKLTGTSIVLVNVSGSMTAPLSSRSEMQRTDAAYGVAVLPARDRREGCCILLLRQSRRSTGAS